MRRLNSVCNDCHDWHVRWHCILTLHNKGDMVGHRYSRIIPNPSFITPRWVPYGIPRLGQSSHPHTHLLAFVTYSGSYPSDANTGTCTHSRHLPKYLHQPSLTLSLHRAVPIYTESGSEMPIATSPHTTSCSVHNYHDYCNPVLSDVEHLLDRSPEVLLAC